MELSNTFTVSSPLEETWPILCDIERIAPCMPGAQLAEVEGDEYRGEVKVKVGPINARFTGTATMVERDDDAHRAVLRARGKDTGGKGNANATITATAEATDDGGTSVTISTDLSITGKVAQFGRSAMADVSTKLLGQFVDCLESRVLSVPGGAEDAVAASASSTASSSGAGGSSDPTSGADGPAATPEPGAATAGPGSPVETAPAPPPGGVPAGTAATGGGGQPYGARKVDAPEAEPIDLLDAAGAPVAKKLAFPVAAVMALFFALYWRRRRSNR